MTLLFYDRLDGGHGLIQPAICVQYLVVEYIGKLQFGSSRCQTPLQGWARLGTAAHQPASQLIDGGGRNHDGDRFGRQPP